MIICLGEIGIWCNIRLDNYEKKIIHAIPSQTTSNLPPTHLYGYEKEN